MDLVWNLVGPSAFVGVFRMTTLIKDAHLIEGSVVVKAMRY